MIEMSFVLWGAFFTATVIFGVWTAIRLNASPYRNMPKVINNTSALDPVASAYIRRLRNERDGLVEYLQSKGDQLSLNQAERIIAVSYKPMRSMDGIINGFKEE